ncbi:MAG TPA: methionine adenosyltransferase [Persephonella sp.]|uniref:Methionine adenosyltransferase n=1 Tax=Persephonella marina (strain DSM 14350 / EX-H1) TaxID=123214 RepID=C0QUI3_PERMH|nr:MULTISPECIES: methionine adenosyltransferase [Persephonella]ACO04648.1 methionine adenosyltransferase [Persephonella marina EX-H1]HCB70035.1 methionine adenosyltransferase [Persephonella sp.]
MKRLKSSESVCQGHPDKIADILSDAILDELIRKDPYTKASIETLITTGLVHISGELSTDAYVDIPEIVRGTLIEIGYTKPEYGFDGYTAGVITTISDQSPELALGIPSGGAGDTCIVVGYATDETENYMPLACNIANEITFTLDEMRKDDFLPFLRPDGKSIVVVEYENNRPLRVDSVTVLIQHEPYITEFDLRDEIEKKIVKKVIPEELIDEKTKIIINPIGRFVIGGPMADTGLTGRKTIADAYGTAAPSGGSAFSGKDPTKIDRSASYMARCIAKHIVASGISKEATVELVYIIGMEYPVSIDIKVDTDIDREKLIKKIKDIFDLSPSGIIERLNLRRPIYKKTSMYGHFGRKDEDFIWEQLDNKILRELKDV